MIDVSLPSNLSYTKDHEWVFLTGSVARIGITDYAQDALGDIVFVQLPEPGAVVSANDSFSEIESTKSVNDVYAPVSGTVSRVNDLLSSSPELVNTDPYGDGWICEIEMSGEASDLLTPDEYQALIG